MRFLFFRPFAGIRQHAVLESQFHKMVGSLGHEFVSLNCNRLYEEFCPVFQNFGVRIEDDTETKKKICTKCETSRNIVSPDGDLLNLYVENADRVKARKFVEQIAKFSETEKTDIFDISTVIEEDLVRSSLYECLLRFKKRDLQFSLEEFSQFSETLYNSHLTRIGMQRYFESNSFDAIFIFTPQYAINNVVAKVGKEFGIETYYLAGNGSIPEMYKSLKVYNWGKYKLSDPALIYWNPSTVNTSILERIRVNRHFNFISKSKSVFTYSAPPQGRSIREIFKIPNGNRLVLAAMSSYDEFLAAKICGYFPIEISEGKVFENQTTWIRELIEWAARREDITLIIRPHPREYPNRREKKAAPSNIELNQVLSSLPENVVIDEPLLKLSMEEHYKEVDLVTVSWSSVSLEALHRNIPVVSYDKNLVMLPADIHHTGLSKDEYFSNLDGLLSGTMPRKSYSELAAKWFKFSHFTGSIRMTGGLQENYFFSKVPKFAGIYARLERKFPVSLYKYEENLAFNKKDSKKLNDLMLTLKDSFYEI